MGAKHCLRLAGTAGLVVLAAILLAACGSSSKSSSSSKTSLASTSSTPASTSSTPAGTSSTSTNSPASVASLLPPDIKSAGSVTIATDASYPPCEYFPTPGAAMVGFEPDLWNAMAAKLGIKVKAVNTSFDGLIPGVQSGRYPIAMECISDSAAREQQVSFVDFIYDTEGVYTTAKNASEITTDPLSLCGKTAAAQTGLDFVGFITKILTPHCVKNGKPAIKLALFPSEAATLLALYAGRVDFVLDDLAALAYLERRAPQPVVLRTDALLPKLYLGIVINKSNTKLQQAMLAALKAIQADGQYAATLKKWKVSSLALKDPGINLATSNPLPSPKP
jgi:polar amino acid transport system substrate-binding protein